MKEITSKIFLSKAISLIGFMGAGKTSIGRLLAKNLNYEFVDTDELIEKQINMTINDYFKLYGEEKFRQEETEVLRNVFKKAQLVVSCGGGAVLRPESQEILKNNSTVIYLKATEEEIFNRVSKSADVRPLLKVDDPKVKIRELLTVRSPIYKSLADFEIDTSRKTKQQVVDEIIKILFKDRD